jgi:hypothetical protein
MRTSKIKGRRKRWRRGRREADEEERRIIGEE